MVALYTEQSTTVAMATPKYRTSVVTDSSDSRFNIKFRASVTLYGGIHHVLKGQFQFYIWSPDLLFSSIMLEIPVHKYT